MSGKMQASSWRDLDRQPRAGYPQGLPRVVRRSKIERYLDIVRVVANHGPIRRTHIMYKANLTWEELKKDLEILRTLNLIEEELVKEGTFYTITPSGLKTLSHYRMVESALMVNRDAEA